MNRESHLDKLGVQIDNYQQTVLALRALANEVLFDDATRSPSTTGSAHCGRRFRTSSLNRQQKDTDVRPDLVIVQTARHGIVAEAKLGFDSEPEGFARRVDETSEQLEKYDDELEGWPAGTISTAAFEHDLVLVVNFEDAKRVVRELDSRRTSHRFSITRNLAIISVIRLGRAEGEWPTLCLESGKLSDADKTRKLENRVMIRPDILARNARFGLVELYDDAPPLPLMMYLVHKAVAGNLTTDEQQGYLVDGRVDKPVTVDEIVGWLVPYGFKRTDGRDAVIPDREWVVLALAKLVQIGWATNGKLRNAFIYHHRSRRRGSSDPLGRFKYLCAKELAKTESKMAKRKERELARTEKAIEKLKKKAPLFAQQIDKEFKPKRPPS